MSELKRTWTESHHAEQQTADSTTQITRHSEAHCDNVCGHVEIRVEEEVDRETTNPDKIESHNVPTLVSVDRIDSPTLLHYVAVAMMCLHLRYISRMSSQLLRATSCVVVISTTHISTSLHSSHPPTSLAHPSHFHHTSDALQLISIHSEHCDDEYHHRSQHSLVHHTEFCHTGTRHVGSKFTSADTPQCPLHPSYSSSLFSCHALIIVERRFV